MMKKQFFDDFTVYVENEGHVFIDINISDENQLYASMFNYFFSEEKLLRYCENKKNIKFEPSTKAYTILYRQLKNYLDSENERMSLPVFEKEIEDILCIEGIVSYEEGERIAKKDKIGKIGEYFFACLLMDFFKFDCIIPKIHLQTDYNMSVYGIDSLFYSGKDEMLLFGESKFSVTLDNGINLIKRSLKDYEKQISDEYELVLCNRFYGDKLNLFHKQYGEFTEYCIDVKQFIDEANIKRIGIPIFIAHGTDTDPQRILNKLNKIPQKKMFNLDTQYYCIALPVLDKYKAIAVFTSKILEKEMLYYNARNM